MAILAKLSVYVLTDGGNCATFWARDISQIYYKTDWTPAESRAAGGPAHRETAD